VDRRAVALGGGHGLAATLTALRALRDVGAVDEVTAIVTVADNGGSSGRLRGEFGVLPPGDLRMALAALCADDEWGQTWAEVIQHRFAGDGDLRGHALGNLLIVSLWELMGDHVRALDWVGRLLGSQGRVLPMAITPMDIRARVRGADPAAPDQVVDVRGQVAVAGTDGLIESVSLEPADPAACPEAVQAVLDAQWVFLGPGSWFTSVIPHLMVPQLREALERTQAKLVVLLNLAEQAGETSGFGPVDYLSALREHAPGLQVHTVLANIASVAEPDELAREAARMGACLVLADLEVPGEPRHDTSKLARSFGDLWA
jgi:uncharacterized cofD-like protein